MNAAAPRPEPGAGKGAGDENFPVASHLIAARHRGVVMAFYRVARLADDVADHPEFTPEEKLARLEAIRASVTGEADTVPVAIALREGLHARALSPVHILDLLEAFRRDAVKLRYTDWADLMDYCRWSACPVGRFVLDVHGEPTSVWPASDSLCAALQVINHLQDCAKDYRELNRVYLPLSYLHGAGLQVDDLGAARASPPLRAVIADLARRTEGLLRTARPLASSVCDRRLSLEIGVIQTLAESLTQRLVRRDPLSERVHHSKPEAIALALGGVAATLLRPRRAQPQTAPLGVGEGGAP